MSYVDELYEAGRAVVATGERYAISAGELLAETLTAVFGATALGVGVAAEIVGTRRGNPSLRVITQQEVLDRSRPGGGGIRAIGGGPLPSQREPIFEPRPLPSWEVTFDPNAGGLPVPQDVSGYDLGPSEWDKFMVGLGVALPTLERIAERILAPRPQAPESQIQARPGQFTQGDVGLIYGANQAAAYYPTVSDLTSSSSSSEPAPRSSSKSKECNCEKKKPRCKPGWRTIKVVTSRKTSGKNVTQTYHTVRKYKDCKSGRYKKPKRAA